MTKWWLINDKDVKEIRNALINSDQEEVLHTMVTGLHTTDVIPKDYLELRHDKCPECDSEEGYYWDEMKQTLCLGCGVFYDSSEQTITEEEKQ